MKNPKNICIILYPRVNDHSSRILKQAYYLTEQNIVDEVLILSMYFDSKLEEVVKISDKINIRRLKSVTHGLPKNALGDAIKFYVFNNLCKKIIKDISPSLVIPHSLSVLPIGVWAKKSFNVKLVYDAHELETERFNLKGLRQTISRRMERKLIGHCDKVIVVNEAILKWYQAAYNLQNIYSIPNIPINNAPGRILPKSNILREEFGLKENTIIFLYQGILSSGRGINELLEIFSEGGIQEDRVIIFMGYGELAEEIKTLSRTNNQIYFKPAVSPGSILENTRGADVGLFFILKEMCLSYQLSLPNKFYEYAMAGLYLCVNDKFPIMEELIVKHNLGKVVGSSKGEIKKFIQTITFDEVNNVYEKSLEYRANLGWHQNLEALNEIFQ